MHRRSSPTPGRATIFGEEVRSIISSKSQFTFLNSILVARRSSLHILIPETSLRDNEAAEDDDKEARRWAEHGQPD